MLDRSSISLLLCLLESFFVHLFCLQEIFCSKRGKKAWLPSSISHFQSPLLMLMMCKGQGLPGTHHDLGRLRKHPARLPTLRAGEQSDDGTWCCFSIKISQKQISCKSSVLLEKLLETKDMGNKIPWQPFGSVCEINSKSDLLLKLKLTTPNQHCSSALQHRSRSLQPAPAQCQAGHVFTDLCA